MDNNLMLKSTAKAIFFALVFAALVFLVAFDVFPEHSKKIVFFSMATVMLGTNNAAIVKQCKN